MDPYIRNIHADHIGLSRFVAQSCSPIQDILHFCFEYDGYAVNYLLSSVRCICISHSTHMAKRLIPGWNTDLQQWKINISSPLKKYNIISLTERALSSDPTAFD